MPLCIRHVWPSSSGLVFIYPAYSKFIFDTGTTFFDSGAAFINTYTDPFINANPYTKFIFHSNIIHSSSSSD
jgi:hypothetical protein